MKPIMETPTSSIAKSDLQFYTPGRHKHIREDSLVLTPFVNNLPMKRCCNCEKSRCIKLYCECYANGVYCDGCNCVDCLNTPNHEDSRKMAIQTTLEKNPGAFQPKISGNQLEMKFSDVLPYARHNKGCTCKKSNCQKKYCECFQAGVPCTDLCKCMDCKNTEFLTQNELPANQKSLNQSMAECDDVHTPKLGALVRQHQQDQQHHHFDSENLQVQPNLKHNKFLYRIF